MMDCDVIGMVIDGFGSPVGCSQVEPTVFAMGVKIGLK
jgi:hypothetical protein